jgi:ribosomal protein S18 acetylase RimI-like enzyme
MNSFVKKKGPIKMAQFRLATDKDEEGLKNLMKAINHENEKDISNIVYCALNAGICVVSASKKGTMNGAIFAVQLTSNETTSHYLNHLTILIDPKQKNQGLGKELVQQFLSVLETENENIFMVQVSTSESNSKLIEYYKECGFEQEGKLKNRFHIKDQFHSEIILSWKNPSFK